jgi:hypothetical protein
MAVSRGKSAAYDAPSLRGIATMVRMMALIL